MIVYFWIDREYESVRSKGYDKTSHDTKVFTLTKAEYSLRRESNPTSTDIAKETGDTDDDNCCVNIDDEVTRIKRTIEGENINNYFVREDDDSSKSVE